MCLILSLFDLFLGRTVFFHTFVVFSLFFFFLVRLDKDILSTHMPLYGC